MIHSKYISDSERSFKLNDFMTRELTLEDLHPDLLQSFNRYQEVRRCWRMENGEWILKNISFTEQYLQLMQIHVSYEYRSKGIGRELFALCSEKARQLGAKKLYISTHSSEESQHFYKSVGCVDAEEMNKKLAEYEPDDRQMEFIL